MVMIMKEERAKLRTVICLETRGINMLLDDLEEAEEMVSLITAISDADSARHKKALDALEITQQSLLNAERQLDVLAKRLKRYGCPDRAVGCDKVECKACWLEWAAQEAAKGE